MSLGQQPVHGVSGLVPAGEFSQRRPLGQQVVRHLVLVGMAKRQSADHDLFIRYAKFAPDDALVAAKGGLRAGMQATRASSMS